MALKEFLIELKNQINSILNPATPVKVTTTVSVPNVEDAGFTLADGEGFKAKTLETCVLFIDIRNSTQMNFKHTHEDMAKLYSVFIISMLQAAEYFGGYVRNINGDRIMVLFDAKDCFKNAVNTAFLLNTVSQYLINKHFKKDDFRCGIGIDYGQMLVVKTGTIKQGKENQFYKSFVWLGKPANLASKLTDLANKDNFLYKITKKVKLLSFIKNPPSHSPKLGSVEREKEYTLDINEFAENLTKQNASSSVEHEKKPVLYWSRVKTYKHPVLMTKEVYDGFVTAVPNDKSITNKWITASSIKIKGYSNAIYGADVYFTAVNNI